MYRWTSSLRVVFLSATTLSTLLAFVTHSFLQWILDSHLAEYSDITLLSFMFSIIFRGLSDQIDELLADVSVLNQTEDETIYHHLSKVLTTIRRGFPMFHRGSLFLRKRTLLLLHEVTQPVTPARSAPSSSS